MGKTVDFNRLRGAASCFYKKHRLLLKGDDDLVLLDSELLRWYESQDEDRVRGVLIEDDKDVGFMLQAEALDAFKNIASQTFRALIDKRFVGDPIFETLGKRSIQLISAWHGSRAAISTFRLDDEILDERDWVVRTLNVALADVRKATE